MLREAVAAGTEVGKKAKEANFCSGTPMNNRVSQLELRTRFFWTGGGEGFFGGGGVFG